MHNYTINTTKQNKRFNPPAGGLKRLFCWTQQDSPDISKIFDFDEILRILDFVTPPCGDKIGRTCHLLSVPITKVDPTGLEPATSSVQVRRSTR